MDLSALSNEDLIALKSGDLGKVSDAGLRSLKGGPKDYKALYKPEAVDPTEGMDTWDRFFAGAGKALSDTGLGLKQVASHVVPWMDPAKVTQEVIEARQRDKPLMDTGAGFTGNLAGNIGIALAPGGALKAAGTAAAALPATARVAQALNAAGGTLLAPQSIRSALAVGGTMGALQPAESGSERITNALLGAGLSGGAQALTRGAARMANPQTAPEVKKLIEEGVSLTPGQIMGGVAQRVEDGATSLPVIGDAIKAAQRRGIESFDAAAINRALKPIGKVLPKDLKGQQAVKFAEEALGEAYDSLLPKMIGNLDNAAPANALPGVAGQAAKPTFRQELDVIRKMGDGLPEAQASQLNRIIDNEVVKRFTEGGRASGETLKNIESKLGGLVKDFSRSDNYDVRTMGDAVKEIRNAMRRMIEDVNPGIGDELAAINGGWANFKRIQKAAGALGANDGVFTPAQLQNAVKAGDFSKDKARFAVGEALMQDLSGAGKKVLSQTVPDSGTPFRIASNMAMVGGGSLFNPLIGAGALGAAGAYTKPAQKVIEALLVKRPELARQFGRQLAEAAPYAGTAALPVGLTVNASQ